jgi:RNA polymerase sigma factor (TIGR02999 family)
MAEITEILQRLSAGDRLANEELANLVYDQLRVVAQNQLAAEVNKRGWDATELVNEAYIRLIGNTEIAWQDRTHFFATAATAIRRVIIDNARQAKAQKRGGEGSRLDITLSGFGREDLGFEIVDLAEALERLESLSERQAKLVELRFFGGLTESEAAKLLGVSRRTVAGDWAMAKAWLYKELNDE